MSKFVEIYYTELTQIQTHLPSLQHNLSVMGGEIIPEKYYFI